MAILGGSVQQSVVVGAPFTGNHAGAAFFFYGSGHRWSQPQKLVADDGAAGDQLGYSVAIGLLPGGNLQEVETGAPLATVNGKAGKGAVYAFQGRAGGGWTQAKLTSYYGVAGENFGASTAISGDTTWSARLPCRASSIALLSRRVHRNCKGQCTYHPVAPRNRR